MTSEWQHTTIESVITSCDYGLSCALSTDPAGVPILRMGNLQGGQVSLTDLKYAPSERVGEQHLLRSGDVLLNRTNSIDLVGKVGLFQADARVTFASYLFRLRTDPTKALPEWLVQILHSRTYQTMLRDIATPGVSQANINRDRLRSLPLRVPPLGEQRKISAILSSVDEAIEATQAVIEQLQVVKKAIMAELLTRGLPGRHTRFKQTDVGEVPEEWDVVRLGTLANVVRGSTPRPARDPRYFNGTAVPWITVGELSKDDWPFLTATETCLTKAGSERSRLLTQGTLVLSNSGFGCGVPKILQIDGCANDGVAAFLDLEQEPLFLYYVLSSLTEHLRNTVARGVEQPNLNTTLIGDLLVPSPPLTEQRAIARICLSLDERILAERQGTIGGVALKDALMSVLLTGEVRVKPDEESA